MAMKSGQWTATSLTTEGGSMRAIMQPISPWAPTAIQDGISTAPPLTESTIAATIGARNRAAGTRNHTSTAPSPIDSAANAAHCAATG